MRPFPARMKQDKADRTAPHQRLADNTNKRAAMVFLSYSRLVAPRGFQAISSRLARLRLSIQPQQTSKRSAAA